MPKSIDELRAIVAQLRAPNGCPWDREQTHATLRGGLLEEAYEVVEAIEEQDDQHLCEELGDLLLQVVMHSQIASEEGRFDFDAVARGISEKLVRRHPHVFGETKVADTSAVLKQWDEIKRAERGGEVQTSALDGVSAGLPALMHAEKVTKKAGKVGFDWDRPEPILEKIREEVDEVAEVLATEGKGSERLEEEIGDLFFAVVNLARKVGVEGEVALRRATNKFSRRFRRLEALMKESGKSFEGASLAELDLVWDQVKAEERA